MCEHGVRYCVLIHCTLMLRESVPPYNVRFVISGVSEHVLPSGMTEEQAKEDYDILVGVEKYGEVAKGYAMAEEDGFVKVIVDGRTGKILGAHIIGPHAAILVQQLVYLMNAGEQDYWPLAMAQTIHPALSEVVVGAFGNLRPAGAHRHEHVH